MGFPSLFSVQLCRRLRPTVVSTNSTAGRKTNGLAVLYAQSHSISVSGILGFLEDASQSIKNQPVGHRCAAMLSLAFQLAYIMPVVRMEGHWRPASCWWDTLRGTTRSHAAVGESQASIHQRPLMVQANTPRGCSRSQQQALLHRTSHCFVPRTVADLCCGPQSLCFVCHDTRLAVIIVFPCCVA